MFTKLYANLAKQDKKLFHSFNKDFERTFLPWKRSFSFSNNNHKTSLSGQSNFDNQNSASAFVYFINEK